MHEYIPVAFMFYFIAAVGFENFMHVSCRLHSSLSLWVFCALWPVTLPFILLMILLAMLVRSLKKMLR